MRNLDWDAIIMKLEIRWVKFRINFWSKLCRYAGDKTLETIDDSKFIKDEVEKWYPELRNYYGKTMMR